MWNISSTQEIDQSMISSATYYNKPYANGWSSASVPSYAAFPSSKYQFHTNSNVFGSSYNSSPNIAAMEGCNTGKVMEFHLSNRWKEYFEASKHSNKLIVIFFKATWCGPCKTIEPAIERLAIKYIDVDFVKIDVDELFDVSLEYGIQTMPTFLLIKNGKQMDKVLGAVKEDVYRKTIERHRF